MLTKQGALCFIVWKMWLPPSFSDRTKNLWPLDYSHLVTKCIQIRPKMMSAGFPCYINHRFSFSIHVLVKCSLSFFNRYWDSVKKLPNLLYFSLPMGYVHAYKFTYINTYTHLTFHLEAISTYTKVRKIVSKNTHIFHLDSPTIFCPIFFFMCSFCIYISLAIWMYVIYRSLSF